MKSNFYNTYCDIPENSRMISSQPGPRKWNHYLRIYDSIWEKFPSPPKVCEIGVDAGDSLKMFAAASQFVLGIDIKPQICEFPDNVAYRQCCQSNQTLLAEIVSSYRQFDIIIDDASHQYEYTKNTFFTLFEFLKCGGKYVIEDFAALSQTRSIFENLSGSTIENHRAILPFAKNLINEVAVWGGHETRNFSEVRFAKLEYYSNMIVVTKAF